MPIGAALSVIARFGQRQDRDTGPWLGIGGMGASLDDAVVSEFRLARDKGVLLLEVVADSPAARAGLRLLDVIVAVDGRPVASPEELQKAIAGVRPGQPLVVAFLRTSRLRRVTVLVE